MDLAARIGLFEEVLASDENLKAAAKAEILTAWFGRGDFDYAGDARADRFRTDFPESRFRATRPHLPSCCQFGDDA